MNAEGNILPSIASEALATHFKQSPPVSRELTPYLRQRKGVFVTIRNNSGELRGCRGCLEAQHANLIEATQELALSSALHDNRFSPITEGELDTLNFEVSVIHSGEPVASLEELDPSVFGVRVSTWTGQSAFMLPNVPGLDDAHSQVEATRKKAGIQKGVAVQWTRYRVDKFGACPSSHP